MNLKVIRDNATRFISTNCFTRFSRKTNHNQHSCRLSCTIIISFSIFLLLFIVGYKILKIGNTPQEIVYHPLILEDVKTFPTKVLPVDSSKTIGTNISCTFFGCFDVYRCGTQGNKLLVYVYPPITYVDYLGKPIVGQMTREFYEILQTIVSSKFYTSNPQEACILIPSIDTLNQNRLKLRRVSQALNTLEFWNNGENHLLFNMIPGSVPDYKSVLDVSLGKAMVAGAGFSSLTYRSGFDISIPVYSPVLMQIKANVSHPRSWFCVSTQINLNGAFEQDLMEIRATYPNNLLILGPCLQYNPMNSSIRCTGQNVYKYVDVLQNSTFCLVMRGARLGQSVLLEALAAGCIPVVISDSFIMPFHGFIDWMRAAVFIREVDILSVVPTLKKISRKRVTEMQRNCIWLFEKYFVSMKKITEMTLEVIEDRVFPHLARDYAHWNLPRRTERMSPLFAPITAPKIRGFTAVILTYDRQELLFSLITKLAKVPSLSKVLVIWNNQHTDPPHPSRWPKIMKPLKVIQTKQNRLSNRFYPYDEIETEAILSIDDDIIMLTIDEVEFAYEVMCYMYGCERDRTNIAEENFFVTIDLWDKGRERVTAKFRDAVCRFPFLSEKQGCKVEPCTLLPHYCLCSTKPPPRGSMLMNFGFLIEEALWNIDNNEEATCKVWREFPDRIVGFPSRTHTWDNGTNCWRYESEWTNRISMVLTGAAFHHKFWSYMYTTAMPGDIKSWVDDHMNCEDIAMNFLVANVTGKAPIKVTPKKKFRCPECTNTEMLSADLTHMVERTQCINRFSEIYKTMPLRSVEFRADPVLFKDQFPEKLKRFREIGSL